MSGRRRVEAGVCALKCRRRPFDSSLLGHLSLQISGSHNFFLHCFEWECPPRPISLSTWVPVGGRTVWGRLGDVALLAKEVCHCMQALKFQKTHTIPSQSLSKCALSATVPASACRLLPSSPLGQSWILNLWNHKLRIISFFYYLFWLQCFITAKSEVTKNKKKHK